MRRIQHVSLLTLAGILLMIASFIPTIPQPSVMRDAKSREQGEPPRAAAYVDYLYTIGMTGTAGSDNGHFLYPVGVATNATGHLYVVDKNNHRVQVFNKAGIYQYTIGVVAESGSDSTHFNTPQGVAVNGTGYVYVADSSNNRVQVFDNAGIYLYTLSGFLLPCGVAVNASGHVYVADTNNHRVQVFNNAGIFQYTMGTGSGTGIYQFLGPQGVAVNNTGHVYVADTNNHRVQVFDNAGIYQYTMGVTGIYGTDNTHFRYPVGIAVNATRHLYVADSSNHRIQVFNATGTYEYTIGVTGTSGTGNGRFDNPKGIAVNATGYLYVADAWNHRVQVFNNGTPISLTIAISGGAAETGITSVTLSLTAHDAAQMCFSNNGTTYTDWENYASSKVWAIDNIAGVRTVYFKAKNVHGESAPVTDTIIYVLAPTDLSILINSGATETGNPDVTLTLGARGATQMCLSNNGSTYTIWETYDTTKAWTLAGGPGPKTVYFLARNSTFSAAIPASADITYIVPPTGLSLLINGGAPDTNITNVTLAPSATGATQMCFSNNGTSYTDWEAFGATKVWILDGGPGPKIVYFKAGNSSIEAAAPVSAAINYILSPTGLSITIDGGATQTGITNVSLTLSATGATEMCFSNNGTTYTAWEPYNTNKAWTLDGGAGLKIVYFKVQNGSIEAMSPATSTITYVGPPSDMLIIINDGAIMTASHSVALVVWASGAEEMCFSNDGVAWSAWETFTTTKTWGLAGGPGSKVVYFKARNIFHESVISTFIAYTLPPTGLSIIINGGAVETTNHTVTLTLSATGATHMCFSNDGVAWSVWESFATTKSWNLSTTAGYKTVYFKTCNNTIESAGPVVASINYAASDQLQTDMPAWAWVILFAVLVEGVGVIAIIWFRGRNSHARDIPPALGGEKKTHLGLLKGKMSQLKGKIFKQDAAGAATGEKKPEEKVTEITWKPAPQPAPTVVPVAAPAKKVEAPELTPVPLPAKKVEAPKPAPAPGPAKKVEAPKPAPAPGPAKKVEAPKPAPAPTRENGLEAPKPAKKPAKKASKKTAKKPA